MPTNAKQLGATVVFAPKRRKPFWTPTKDGGAHRHSLHVGDGAGATIQAHIGRKGGFEAGLALLALERFNERGFLTCGMMIDVYAGKP